MSDRRERFQPWYHAFDRVAMTITLLDPGDVEDGDLDANEVPAEYTVCGTCDGHGSHVAAGIDSHGLTAEDFDADPDFREDYFGGAYDVACVECKGLRVSPCVDDSRLTPAQRKAVDEALDSYDRAMRELAAERHYGY